MSDEKTMFLQSSPMAARKTGAGGSAVLVSIYPPGPKMGHRFALTKDEHVVGRLEELDVPLDGEGLSRRHAKIFRDTDGWQIEDLGSTNGTIVNDVKISQKSLNDGDIVRFGTAICKFLAGDNIEAAYHEEMHRVTIMDGLTDVHNKRYFLDFLEKELVLAMRQQKPVSLIMIDIDHFKKINDTHGHLAGDAALKELCRRLKPEVRDVDLLARYGGEEFGVVLSGTDREGALGIAEVFRQLVEREPFTYEQIKVPCTISLGVAECDLTGPTRPNDLIKVADENLYEAKRSGRNRAVG